VFAFEDGAVTVDVVEAFGQIVSVFLGVFAQVARTIALAGLTPSAFIEGDAKDREIGVEFVEVGFIGSA
jgi:hypothetical protein